MLYLEDLSPGDRFDCGTETVDRAEMVTFAERYDPQQFHLQEDHDNPFDGLVASGWYTAAVCMRRLVEEALDTIAATGAEGIDELRWPAPLRPGDRISVMAEVAGVEPTSERRGRVRLSVTGRRNTIADAETVLTYIGLVLVERRPA